MRIEAFFELPPSLSARQRDKRKGMPHRQKPDGDNVLKAVADALFEDDAQIADWQIRKRWDDGHGPRICITLEEGVPCL